MERNRTAHYMLERALQNLASKFRLHGAKAIHESMNYRIKLWNSAAVDYDFYEEGTRQTCYHLFTQAEDEAGDEARYTIDIYETPEKHHMTIWVATTVLKEVEFIG
jgi:hypothetical protein